VFSQTLFVGTHDGKLVALHKETGTLIWDKNVSIAKGRSEVERMVDVVSDIRADDATIFISGYQGRVAAINPQTGNMEWQRDLSVHEDFSVDKKAIYLTGSTGVLIALDKLTGATLWQQDVLKGRRPTGPLVCPPYLLVGDAGGYWHWFNLGDGARVAAKEMGDGIVAMPLKSGPWVVGLAQDGTLIAAKVQ
jgi:outer membrane protein assembly factor BamB